LETCKRTHKRETMRTYYKLSKVRNSNGEQVEYLQIWEGEAKGQGKLIRTVGRAEKLLTLLVRADRFEKLTKDYPEILTKLTGDAEPKND
jgi:hypothetical protein